MHPIKKILPIIGISVVCNGIGDMTTETLTFAWYFLFSTLPALQGVAIDRIVNQSITINKTIQYALISVETFVMAASLEFIINTSLSSDWGIGFISTMVQAAAIKYIWGISELNIEITPEDREMLEIR
jgi:hypothetical protein